MVGKISAFPPRCSGAVSAFPLRFPMFRHQFLSFSGSCARVGRSPFALASSSLRELRFGVRMCLPELIRVVFYSAPYQQLQRERRRHLGCFQRPLPAGLSPGPTLGCFPPIYKLFQGWNHSFSDVGCLTKSGLNALCLLGLPGWVRCSPDPLPWARFPSLPGGGNHP